jgi:hypothetical protein
MQPDVEQEGSSQPPVWREVYALMDSYFWSSGSTVLRDMGERLRHISTKHPEKRPDKNLIFAFLLADLEMGYLRAWRPGVQCTKAEIQLSHSGSTASSTASNAMSHPPLREVVSYTPSSTFLSYFFSDSW